MLHAINSMAGWWPWLDAFMRLVSSVSPLAGLLLLAGLWAFPGPGRRERRLDVALTGMAVVLALGLNVLPTYVYYRPRPFLEHRVTLLGSRLPSASFPSDHAAGSAAAAAYLAYRSRRVSLATWTPAMLVMLSRVYVGVHYPSDVLGGCLIGWSMGATVRYNRDALKPFARRLVAFGEELL